MIAETRPLAIEAATIISQSAKAFGVKPESLIDYRRGCPMTCQARHVAMFVINKRTHADLDTIGRLFSKRGSQTVLRAFREVKSRAKHDQEFARKANPIINQES